MKIKAESFPLVGIMLSLLLLSVPVIAAQTIQVGNWSYWVNGDGGMAATTSDTGAELGIICSHSQSQCKFYITSSSACTDGQSVPILENATEGATNLIATCKLITISGRQFYALLLSPIEPVASAFAQDGSVVGFAEPMADGEFRVYRFSSTGASTAIGFVTNYAKQPVGDQTY